MNKAELAAIVAEQAGVSLTQAEQTLNITLEGIMSAVSNGDTVSLIGFGNFGVRQRAARKARNPQTGKEMDVPAKKVPFFKAGKKLKELVDTTK